MSEELPDELKKLEIAPGELQELGLVQLKLFDNTELPLTLNPFYEEDKKLIGIDMATDAQTSASASATQRIRNQVGCRRCRLRRRSESVLDEYKRSPTQGATSLTDTSCSSHTTPGVQRQPLKKSSSSTGSSGTRKSLLREPVLCALQNCIHSAQNARRKLQTAHTATEHEATRNITAHHSGSHTSVVTTTRNEEHGMIDFSDLVTECQSLLEQQEPKALRSSKNFTRMQINSGAHRSTGDTTSRHEAIRNCRQGNGDLLANNSNSIIQRNASSPSPEHSVFTRASTSCSQQAGSEAATNMATNCDDVTIDELASYFETLVHIPKKMSSMAEMMYI